MYQYLSFDKILPEFLTLEINDIPCSLIYEHHFTHNGVQNQVSGSRTIFIQTECATVDNIHD